ncbi:MAG TPA: hypothetical protein VJ862_14155 [Rhodanobacteraceae bacterium]|nr:hypothetical protein [Rhodanobacteraceae bacterium]
MKRLPLLLFVLAPVALTGCQTIKAHNPFRHKEPAYTSAQQEQPLEVPPGMNQPATSEALVIPGGANAPEATSTATAGAPSMTPTEGSTSLALADTPDSAYHRVGLALDRGGIGNVTARDDAAHTYQVAIDTTVTEKSQGGFFHRLFHRSKSEPVTGNVTVSVAPQGSGSVVQATGNPDAAARVITLLKQRLQ